MELISKKVYNGDFRNRFSKDNPYPYGDDVSIEEEGREIFYGINIPILKGSTVVEGSVEYYDYIRFRTLANCFSRLNKIVETAELYRLCVRYDEDYWRDEGKAFEGTGCTITPNADTVWVITDLDLLSGVTVGDYAVVTDDAEWFNNVFSGLTYATEFYEVACDILSNNSGGVVPTFSVMLQLVEDIEDLGVFTPYDEEIDETADSGDNFIGYGLKKRGVLKEITDSIWEYSGEPKKGVEIFIGGEAAQDGDYITQYGTITITDGKISSIVNDEFKESSGETQSYIGELKRNVISVDYDGNELPFIFYFNDDKVVTELPYIIGQPQNLMVNSDGSCSYDVLNSVSIYNEGEEVSGTTWDTVGEHIKTIEDGECPFEGYSMIKFEYERGARIEPGKTPGQSVKIPGLSYTEVYSYVIEEGEEYKLDGKKKYQPKYIKIDYTQGYSSVVTIDEDAENDVIEVNNLIYDESLIGAHNYSQSVSVNIERGSSASFEPLSLMGQMNSLEDIERYRGDLFNIKKENS